MAAATTVVDDPKFEWTEKANSYVLRLALPGFRKDDFRVQVDGFGRLTVRSSRHAAAAGQSSINKVFPLPLDASLEDIKGRFEAGVLTLTVPKHTSSAPAPSAAKEEGITGCNKEDALKKTMEEATNKGQEKNQVEEEQQPAPAPMNQEQQVKPEPPQAAAAGPAQKPEVATGGEKAKPAVAPDSLAEEAKAEQEKKATAWYSSGGWKERVQGDLKVLTDMKWADGMVEAARKNKEVVAVGIAAFSLGALVSHRLFRK